VTLRLRVKTIGTGKLDDAYRVNIPTYALLEHDEAKKIAVIEIPDSAHPFTLDEITAIPHTDTPHGPTITALPAEHLRKLHDHYAEKYVKPVVPYSLEVV
jgi:hypothetical protein